MNDRDYIVPDEIAVEAIMQWAHSLPFDGVCAAYSWYDLVKSIGRIVAYFAPTDMQITFCSTDDQHRLRLAEGVVKNYHLKKFRYPVNVRQPVLIDEWVV